MTDRPSSQDDLFGSVQEEGGRYVEPSAPLAGRMRPRSLDELVGQDAVIGPGSVLREAVEADQLPSLILWGPPGSGKGDQGSVPLTDFIAKAKALVAGQSTEL